MMRCAIPFRYTRLKLCRLDFACILSWDREIHPRYRVGQEVPAAGGVVGNEDPARPLHAVRIDQVSGRRVYYTEVISSCCSVLIFRGTVVLSLRGTLGRSLSLTR